MKGRQPTSENTYRVLSPEEAAGTIWLVATNGKDRLRYPVDSVCRKLYGQYTGMGTEDFKQYFSRILFEK